MKRLLFSTTLLAESTAASTATSSNAMPDFYHTSDDILAEFNAMVNDCEGAILSVKVTEGTSVPLTVATFSAKQDKRKDDSSTSITSMNRAMILFGEHARELISPETALQMARDLCGKNEATRELAKKVLENNVITMIPIANPMGRKAVEGGAFCQRVNENGVDLNRNWDAHWESASDGDQNPDTNPGEKPFSEPETQALKKLVDDIQPTIFITVHSGTLGMYTPYAYSRDLPTNDPSDLGRMRDILNTLNPDYCQCPSGAAGKDVGYLCPGTCLDYAYEHHSSISFAFEIYAADADEIHSRWRQDHEQTLVEIQQQGMSKNQPRSAGYSCFLQTTSTHHHEHRTRMTESGNYQDDECFRDFNPGNEETYKETVSKWSEAFLKMCDMAADSALVRDLHRDQLTSTKSTLKSVLRSNQGKGGSVKQALAQPAMKALEHMLRMKQSDDSQEPSTTSTRLRGGGGGGDDAVDATIAQERMASALEDGEGGGEQVSGEIPWRGGEMVEEDQQMMENPEPGMMMSDVSTLDQQREFALEKASGEYHH